MSGTGWSRVLPEGRRHFVEPLDRALFGPNPPAQHQVLMQSAAAECAWIGELAFFEPSVGVEQFGPLGAKRTDLGAEHGDVAVCGGAELDGQIAGAIVGHRTASA